MELECGYLRNIIVGLPRESRIIRVGCCYRSVYRSGGRRAGGARRGPRAVSQAAAGGGASRAPARWPVRRRAESQLAVMCDRWRIATMHRTRSEHDNASFNFIYIQPPPRLRSECPRCARARRAPAVRRHMNSFVTMSKAIYLPYCNGY